MFAASARSAALSAGLGRRAASTIAQKYSHAVFSAALKKSPADLDKVLDAVNATGMGLTFGFHSRIDDRVQQVVDRVRAGNLYINRNQIGAVVGSQPFGGEGLSGTGPKAGGPHYVPRFGPQPRETAEGAWPTKDPGHLAIRLAAADAALADVDALLAQRRIECIGSREGQHPGKIFLQQQPQRREDAAVVVDDQYGSLFGHLSGLIFG